MNCRPPSTRLISASQSEHLQYRREDHLVDAMDASILAVRVGLRKTLSLMAQGWIQWQNLLRIFIRSSFAAGEVHNRLKSRSKSCKLAKGGSSSQKPTSPLG